MSSDFLLPHPNQLQTEILCFKVVWNIPPLKSFLSGYQLRHYFGTEWWFSCFAHVLPKAVNKYPYFKLYLKNIIKLRPAEHVILDQGTEDSRKRYSEKVPEADWQKIWDLKEVLEEEYKEHFPSTYQGLLNYRYSTEEVLEIIQALNGKFLDEIGYTAKPPIG